MKMRPIIALIPIFSEVQNALRIYNKALYWACWESIIVELSQTSFSLYLHNQWTDFHKLSCARKPQMRAIHTYIGCIKATTNNWDIRLLVTVKVLFTIISWTAKWTYMIELVLESTHQTVSSNISYIIWRSEFIEIQAYQYSNIISYLLKLVWHLLWQITALLGMSFDYMMETACI